MTAETTRAPATATPPPTPTKWVNRITGHAELPAGQIVANDRNFRLHPTAQESALRGALSTVGWVQDVIVNQRTAAAWGDRQNRPTLVDGHLRVRAALAQGADTPVPVEYVDLAPAEEALVLASLDPITALGTNDPDALTALLSTVSSTDAGLQALLDQLQRAADAQTGSAGRARAAHVKLTERFIVPPFSVLDTRQGYWQDRKRAWIDLGLHSELGRGDVMASGGLYAGQSDWAGYRGPRRANATPGGKPMPAMRLRADGHTQPGDSRGTPLSDPESTGSATSIFDPVLCELAYRWFVPPGGSILDPFAGGSVRGIIAALLGRDYTGIDLSEPQIAANRQQWQDVAATWIASDPATTPAAPATATTVTAVPPPRTLPRRAVTVSAASARLLFHGCAPDYIATTCHAHCCESATSPTGTLITIHPTEVARIAARGGLVQNGLLQPAPGARRCPFKTAVDLCGLHDTPDKPFGCIASPFTLNGHDTLIVRNRYKLLTCYKDGGTHPDGTARDPLPAYVAFRASLDLIFGPAESARICAHLDAGGGDLTATMPAASYQMLTENDQIKHGGIPDHSTDNSLRTPPPTLGTPRWILGDSRDVQTLAPGQYDGILTCPPYFDLERYSDDPRDISTLDYAAFRDALRAIIAASCALLKDDRFATIVVGDVRDPHGYYRNFVSDTIAAFHDAGLRLYNAAVLVQVGGSLPLRVGQQFEASRKLGKEHQNLLIFSKGNPAAALFDETRQLYEQHHDVLVFTKGDAKKATAAIGPVQVGDVYMHAAENAITESTP